jgi:hypothetical protein
MSILLLIIFREAAQEIFAVWHWVSLHTHNSINQIKKKTSRLQKSHGSQSSVALLFHLAYAQKQEGKIERFHLTA